MNIEPKFEYKLTVLTNIHLHLFVSVLQNAEALKLISRALNDNHINYALLLNKKDFQVWTLGWIDDQMNGQMDTQIDRQIDR